MPELQIALFGVMQLRRAAQPFTHFSTAKVQALLAYLAVESRRAHARDTLTGLFWSDFAPESARGNLRQTLFRLRQIIPAEYLLITHQTVQFPATPACQIDVTTFINLLATCQQHAHTALPPCTECGMRLAQAVALYQGDFLTGLFLDDSPAFEEWMLLKREWLRREALQALHQLTMLHERRGDYDQAHHYAWRQVELDPACEEAHQQLMRVLAFKGRRSEALAQYVSCRRLLAEELGVAPSAATTALYEQIRAGTFPHPMTAVTGIGQDSDAGRVLPRPASPALLPRTALAVPTLASAPPLFVARSHELAWLQERLNQAVVGQGQVVFVSGEAGSGKSALLREFAGRAQIDNGTLLVVCGQCQALGGLGDPYAPFRHILRLLLGELDLPGSQMLLNRLHANYLADQMIDACQLLVEGSPGLINTFVPGPALISRIAPQVGQPPAWWHQLEQIASRRETDGFAAGQSALFAQYGDWLRALARRQPMLLLIDDLHWADVASLNLLFYVGRQLAESRILVVGAYRAEEVTGGWGSVGREERHPLESVINELQRSSGEFVLDLDQAAGREFVDAWLDTQPNRLDAPFRSALYDHTQGQALFTVELVRAMQARGELVRDAAGHWVEGSTLTWQTLPARVEAVIGERLARLEEPVRQLLAIASVEGEDFTAEVLAHVEAQPVRTLLQTLARTLDRRHRLVQRTGEVQIGKHLLTRYRFSHALFQHYLYAELGVGERRLLHSEIATALEELYGPIGEQTPDGIITQLAHHYAAAAETVKAVTYLLQAGDRARALCAYQAAIAAYQRALVWLKAQRTYEQAARTLMKLGLTYHLAFDFRQAQTAYDEGFVLWRQAGEQQTGLAGTQPGHQPLGFRLVWDEPPTLDPARVVEVLEIVVIDQLFSGLVEWSPELDIVPAVAHTWEMLDGGRQYCFHLRQNARWSDGTSVTAADFVYAWRRALHPTTGSLYGSLLRSIKGAMNFHLGLVADPETLGVRALDDQTLLVELEEPTSYFLHVLAQSPSYPIPRHVVEAHGASWADAGCMVSNGPFCLASWQPGEELVLQRNPAYTGRVTGNVQQIKLTLVPHTDWAARLAAYAADASDFLDLWGFPPVEAERARQRYASEYVSTPWLFTGYLGFDLSQPPFADERVRRAFALATDRTTLANLAMQGYVSPPTGGVIPPGLAGYTPGLGLPYDPAQARQLLAAAGYPGGRGFPTLTAVRPPNPADTILSEALQAQWQDVLGIELRWQTMSWQPFAAALQRRELQLFYGIFLCNYPDPENCLGWYNHVTAAHLTEFSQLMARAEHTTDPYTRLQIYTQADRVLVERAGIIPLYYGRLHLLVKPWVKKLPTSLIKAWFWKDIVVEAHTSALL